MKKIPTVYERDPKDPSRVLTHQCVVDLTGATPTVKWDGSAVRFDGEWWARHCVKPSRVAPDRFDPVEHDPSTGKTFGWVPITDDTQWKWHREAIDNIGGGAAPGTFEVIGPHFNRNPHNLPVDSLVRHGEQALQADPPLNEGLGPAGLVMTVGAEGVVWWRGGEPIGKLKRRDLGLDWPLVEAEADQ